MLRNALYAAASYVADRPLLLRLLSWIFALAFIGGLWWLFLPMRVWWYGLLGEWLL